MGYGLGILGGLGAFAGGLSKGWDEREEQEWNRKVRARQEQQWSEEDELKKALKQLPQPGDVTGARKSYGDFESDTAAQQRLEQARSQLPATVAGTAATPQAAGISTEQIMQGVPQYNIGPKGSVAVAPKTAMATPKTPAPAAPTPKGPTFGEQYLAGANDSGLNLNKALIFKDQLTGRYKITDEDNARKATPMDNIAAQAALYAKFGQPDKALDLRLKGEQWIAANAENNQRKANSILSGAMLKPGGPSSEDISEALRTLSADDNVTLGGRLDIVKTPDGKYTLGGAPDGTNLPLMPVGEKFGSYDTPQQAFMALQALISGKPENFAALQNTVFDQMIRLRAASLDERRVKVSESQLQLGREEFNHRKSVDWYNAKTSRMSATDRANGGFTPKQVMAAQTSMDKVVTSQLSAAGITPDMPNFDEAYGQYAESYLRRNPAVQQMLLGSEAVADMTGSPAPTTDTPPRGAMSRSALPWGGPKLTQRKLPSTQADPRARWRATPQSTDLYRKP